MKLGLAALGVVAGVAMQAGAFVLAAAPPQQRAWAIIISLLVTGLLIAGGALLFAVHDPLTFLVSGTADTTTTALTGFRSGRLQAVLRDASVILAFGIFLPVLGLLGLAVTLYVRGRAGPRRGHSGIVQTDPPRLAGGPLTSDHSGRFGPGSLEGILRHSANQDLRLRVVLACRQLPGRLAVPLLRLALRDRVDDVRLLAYAVLDGKEREIQSQIQATLERAGISDPNSANLPLEIRVRLTELYWELAYQGLVEGDLLSFSIDQVVSHANAILKASQGHPRMALLAGRALLLRRRFERARPMLEESIRRGLSMEVVSPYLAEVDYELRRPDDVRRHVADFAESARLRPNLFRIVERWT